MKLLLTLCFISISVLLSSCKESGDHIYTLYRASPLAPDPEDLNYLRIHIATFDASEGDENYNRGNCEIAKNLFVSQPEVTVKYWCEKGKFKK